MVLISPPENLPRLKSIGFSESRVLIFLEKLSLFTESHSSYKKCILFSGRLTVSHNYWTPCFINNLNIVYISQLAELNSAAVGTLFCFILTWSRSQTSAPQISIVHSYKNYLFLHYIVIINIVLVNKCSSETTLIFLRTFSESISCGLDMCKIFLMAKNVSYKEMTNLFQILWVWIQFEEFIVSYCESECMVCWYLKRTWQRSFFSSFFFAAKEGIGAKKEKEGKRGNRPKIW